MTHISIAGRLMAALPDHTDPLTGAGGPDPNMTTSTTRLGSIVQHPKRVALLALALFALLCAALPHAAQADSYYTDEACQNGGLTWQWFQNGTNIAFDNNQCIYEGINNANDGVDSGVSWNHQGSGPAGGDAYWMFYAPNGPTGQTTVSQFNAGIVASSATDGYGAGMMGDTGSGMLASNDPRNLAIGQSIPNSTVGQTADCWGYGDNKTQVVTADHAGTGSCNVTEQPTTYNLAGHNFLGIGIGAQQRACGDSSDGGSCDSGSSAIAMDTASVVIDDPQNNPVLSSVSVSGLPSGYTSGQWLSSANDSGTIGSSVAAQDSGGVCNLQITISGPSGTVASSGSSMSTKPSGWDSTTSTYAASSGSTPSGCPQTTSTSTSGLSLSGLASGVYTVAASAANPGDVAGSQSPSSTSTTFQVDNQVPTVTITGGSGTWSSNNDQSYHVAASEAQNDSGIASITCTGAGLSAGGQTFSGASADIAETAQGDDAITCYATTGAGISGADGSTINSNVGTDGTGNNILIDASTPATAVDGDSPATKADGLIGAWVDPATDGSPETVDVYAAAGVSGIAAGTTNGATTTPATGTVDQWSTSGVPITSGVSTQASLYNNAVSNAGLSEATIGGQTYGMPYCTVTDLSDPSQTQPYVVNDPSSTTREGNPAATASVDANNKYVEWQIPFTQNGHYQLNCSVTNGAGTTATLAQQTIEVDTTSPSDLQSAAAAANPTPVTDAIGGNAANAYVSTTSQGAANWSGDPLTLSFTPAEATPATPSAQDWPASADLSNTTEVDPIVQTTCVPGGDASGEQTSSTTSTSMSGANPTPTSPDSITIGDKQWKPQSTDQPAAQTPTNNGNDQVTCTETNAAGTTSDPTTYYMNIDQQSPMVDYSQPSGDTGGQTGSASSAAMSPAALSAKTGLPQRDFGLSPLTSHVAPTASDPVPATGHLAPTGPAEFKLNPHGATTGVEYSPTATQVNASAAELSTLSNIYGEYCSDNNQTEPGAGGNVAQPYGDGGVIGTGGSAATLDVPQTGDANDQVTGIHYLTCWGKDLSTIVGSNANGPGDGATKTNFPWTGQVASDGSSDPSAPAVDYHYTVNIDNVSPATVGFGIVNQGETVTNPDPYTYNTGQWYSDEVTLTATAQQVGNDLSDIKAMVCGVDDPTFGQPNSSYTDPVSGQPVPYYDYTLDPNAIERPTDANNAYTVEIPVSADNGSGTYYVSCFAVSGSGVNGTVNTTEVNLQSSSSSGGGGGGGCTQFCPGGPASDLNVPPSGIGPIPGGSEWHTTSQQVPVVAQSPTGSAPIESITCQEPPVTLDGDTSNPNAVDNGDGTITYPNPAGTNSNTESITVTVGPPPLGTPQPAVECYATDAAGVNHTLGSYQVNVDDQAPTGGFVRPNKSDPRKVTLDVTDNAGSGIGKVVIQLINSSGTITNLPLTSNTTGDGAYTAELPPDDQMAKGSYSLQAIVTDNAGNVTNPPINQWNGGGTTAVISYPLLGSSSMIDALGAGTTAPLLPGDKGTTSTKVPETKKIRIKVHGKWVTKTVKVYRTVRVRVKAASGKTKWRTKKVPVYRTVKASAKVLLANVKRPVDLIYAGKSTADGLVSTGSGVPIVGGKVQISQNVNGTVKVLGTATTNNAGRWVYHVPAGPSRELDFQYMGTDLIDAASGSAGAELVTGKMTLTAPRVVKVGSKFTLRGRVAGGFVPAKGVALRLYYSEKGVHGTGDYPITYHTTKNGTYTIKEPSRATARGRTYVFWVKVVTPTTWPYNGATSKKVTVRFH